MDSIHYIIHFDRRDSSAAGFQILASSLPAMVDAMSRPVDTKGKKMKEKLGGITWSVAQHLKAEICSIFLREKSSEGDRLVLEEAYGYEEAAIGTPKSLEEGLTARILKDKVAIVANFDVQDHDGWKGELDKELQGHCWCLLGVPIVGTNGKVHGVIKVENRRRQLAEQESPRDQNTESSISEICTFLRAMASPKNTPAAICKYVDELAEKAADVLKRVRSDQATQLRQLVEQTRQLASGLSECKVSSTIEHQDLPKTGASIGGPEKSKGKPLDHLKSNALEQTIDSLRWYTEALVAAVTRITYSLKELSSDISKPEAALLKVSSDVVPLLQSLKLALDAYQPFGEEDLYLMRAVAAMIAAAIDIRESARTEAFHVLQHALKDVGAEFLSTVDTLAEELQETKSCPVGATADKVTDLFRTALQVSGPYNIVEGYDKLLKISDSHRRASFVALFKGDLMNRLLFYKDYFKWAGKEFCFPETREVSHKYADIEIVNSDAIIGAMDTIITNAQRWGGNKASLNIYRDEEGCHLIISDNGSGFNNDDLQSLFGDEDSEDWFSKGGKFGLKAAKRVLEEAGMRLNAGNNLDGHLTGAYVDIVIPNSI